MKSLASILIDSDKIVQYLKHETMLKDIEEEILHREIVQKAAEEYGVNVSPEETQAEADGFRYRNKLETVSKTYDWLNQQLITPEEWEEGIHHRLLSKKLAEHLFAKEIESYFIQNKTRYEKAILYRIVVPYQALAQELFYKIEEKEISFYEAAHYYDIDPRRRLICGFEGKLSRRELNPDISPMLFSSTPGQVTNVTQSKEGYDLWMVEEFIPLELTPEIRELILNRLFDEWKEREFNHYIHNYVVTTDEPVINQF